MGNKKKRYASIIENKKWGSGHGWKLKSKIPRCNNPNRAREVKRETEKEKHNLAGQTNKLRKEAIGRMDQKSGGGRKNTFQKGGGLIEGRPTENGKKIRKRCGAFKLKKNGIVGRLGTSLGVEQEYAVPHFLGEKKGEKKGIVQTTQGGLDGRKRKKR